MKKIKRQQRTQSLPGEKSNKRASTELQPAANLFNSGYELYQKGRLEEASVFFQKSLEKNPHSAQTLFLLGTVFHARNQLDHAVTFYQKAVEVDPALIGAYYNLGTIYQQRKQLNEAIPYYKRTIELNPDLVHPHYNLGIIFQEQGLQKQALSCYDRALRADPSFFVARWARCIAQIPAIYPDQASIIRSREQYRCELMKLRQEISLNRPEGISAATEAIGRQQPFFLAYQNMNNKELQMAYGDLVCRIMSARYPQFTKQLSMPSLHKSEPLKIGIVSGYFYYHAVWKIPIKGWIENLDKERFHLFGYYTGNKKDRETESARKCFNRFVEDIFSFEELCTMIRADNLHALIFPEIGMDPTTLKLAALRLAPIQCASWGHAETSGLPTIDYFLSSELIEPYDAEGHYTERLVRLPNLSIYYAPPELKAADLSRERLGLRQKSVLYHCCQSLYKHSPHYDEVFPRIAKQVPDCQFLFASYPNIDTLREQFRLRITNAFERFHMKADDYVVFLPPLPPDWYHGLNLLSDVYLDTIGWSGCNSVLEALSADLPVVTHPTGFMRGREGFAILTMMGVTETIASTTDDYVNIAARLGNDPKWRSHISGQIRATKHLAYCDTLCIKGLEDFIAGVVHGGLHRWT